jgi:lipopolysaccharide transport system permease protein
MLHETVIRPPSRWPSLGLADFWKFRDLLQVLAWRDVSVRYRQTILGWAWAVIQPVVQMVVFSLIFNKLGGIRTGDATPYPLFLYAGLLYWQLYSSILGAASTSLTGNTALIQKVYFPRLVIPVASCAVPLVDWLVSAVIFGGLMGVYRQVPRLAGIAMCPVLLLLTLVSGLGLGLFLGALNVRYRDVRFALPFAVQMLMYVTPIVYPVKMLEGYPVLKGIVFWMNPIAGIVDLGRISLLGSGTIPVMSLLAVTVGALAHLLVGALYFRATERTVADIV